jgi:hypothetical protein
MVVSPTVAELTPDDIRRGYGSVADAVESSSSGQRRPHVPLPGNAMIFDKHDCIYTNDYHGPVLSAYSGKAKNS